MISWSGVKAIDANYALKEQISPTTKVVGNGDILDRHQGGQLAQQNSLDGVMIGRGIFQDPFLFAQNSPWPSFNETQRIELFIKHVKLFASTWTNNDRPVVVLNKFCKIYIQGFSGAKELRQQLMNCHSTDELLRLLESSLS